MVANILGLCLVVLQISGMENTLSFHRDKRYPFLDRYDWRRSDWRSNWRFYEKLLAPSRRQHLNDYDSILDHDDMHWNYLHYLAYDTREEMENPRSGTVIPFPNIEQKLRFNFDSTTTAKKVDYATKYTTSSNLVSSNTGLDSSVSILNVETDSLGGEETQSTDNQNATLTNLISESNQNNTNASSLNSTVLQKENETAVILKNTDLEASSTASESILPTGISGNATKDEALPTGNSDASVSTTVISTIEEINESTSTSDSEANSTINEGTDNQSDASTQVPQNETDDLILPTNSSDDSSLDDTAAPVTNEMSENTPTFPSESDTSEDVQSTSSQPISSTDQTQYSVSDFESSKIMDKTSEDITSTLVSTESKSSGNEFVTENEIVINIASIRTARMVVSVVFLVIAIIAVTVLAVYMFAVKRKAVKYDQITLLP